MAQETAQQQTSIDSILNENRKFEPSAEFRSKAHIRSLEDYERLYRESVEDPDKFWGSVAKELHWFNPWDKLLECDCPWVKLFVGGETNIS
jgi:acetyl-CoA synthetase